MTDPDFMAHMGQSFDLAMKVKSAMKAKGKLSAWTKCPRCGGKVHAVLAGRKQHIHLACETAGCIRLME